MTAPGEHKPHPSINACAHLRARALARGRADMAAKLLVMEQQLAEQIQREQMEREEREDGNSAT